MPAKLYLILFLLIAHTACAQKSVLDKAVKRHAQIFEDNKTKPQVLLLGVFHFAGEQVDANTTAANLKVNMLSADRQKQVQYLVNRLAAFKPTKIAIEVSPRLQAKYDSLYREYSSGKILDPKSVNAADESVQLGFRLAKMLKLQKLYAIDAQPFRFKLSKADSVLTFEKYQNQTDSSYTYLEKPYEEEKLHQDSLAYFASLNQYLAYLNSPQKQARAIGRWLVTTKRGANSEPIGADGFITRYFNRNVRIYSNVQRMVDDKHDRILVIYGATHMYMLKQLFQASPEFKLVDVMAYLK